MQILSRATNWIQSQVATKNDDFKQDPGPERSAEQDTLKLSTLVGAGTGTVVGGTMAANEIAGDSVYFDYVSKELPLAASGPQALDVFGSDFQQFESLVRGQSSSASSSRETLQYLSYLKQQNPGLNQNDLQALYKSLEGQLADDGNVREALNMIAAHVGKYGSSPSEAYREFANHMDFETDFAQATKTFLQDQKLSDSELNMTTVNMVQKHTSPIGHLGMTKAVVLGAASGAVIGAVSGLGIGLAINFASKLINSDN